MAQAVVSWTQFHVNAINASLDGLAIAVKFVIYNVLVVEL